MARQFMLGPTRFAIEVTPNLLKRVRALTQFRLEWVVDLGRKPSALEELTGDIVLLVDVLYACVQPQCEALGWDSAAFGEAVATRDALDEAMLALFHALEDFFHAGRSAPLRTILEKAQQFGLQTRKIGAEANEALDRFVTKTVQDKLMSLQQTVSGVLSGTTPESSESIPGSGA